MVNPVNLFDLAAKHSDWLSVRQNAVARNVANANTPGYRSVDAIPFSRVVSGDFGGGNFAMKITNPRHMNSAGFIQNIAMVQQGGEDITTSGNDVNIEHELNKGAQITQQMQLNTSVVKAFNQMYMNVLK